MLAQLSKRSFRELGPREVWRKWAVRTLVYGTVVALLAVAVFDVAAVRRINLAQRSQATAAQSQIDQGAEVFATRFVTDYLTYNAGQADAYTRRLQPYLAPGVAADQAWNGIGQQSVRVALPVSERASGALELVTVAAQLSQGQWTYLAVPVAAIGGGYTVVGLPATIPAPTAATYQGSAANLNVDEQLSTQLHDNLASFWRAYGAGDQSQLAYFAAPGATLVGLGGTLVFASMPSLQVEAGGSNRGATSEVLWQDPASGAQLRQDYRLRLQQVSGKWLIASVGPSSQGGNQ
ncbi:MAG: conjugal transfer protein [Candidatus Dormibacteraeota bacterium]|nr:conjugal transfer protein [Candidatus Dormibacteraeota bacterium]